MDIFGAEAALAGLVARVTSLELNRSVFPGELPDSVVDGIGVCFEAGAPPTPDRQIEGSARIDLCFSGRTELEAALHALLNNLPQYDVDGLTAVEPGERMDLSKIIRRGIPVYRVILPLKVSFI